MGIKKDKYPLIIIGAGPGGITAALYAQKLGLEFLLIDKQDFPKDKICGDALAPPVFSILKELEIDTSELESKMYSPDQFHFTVSDTDRNETFINHFTEESRAYNCKREIFDYFLFSHIQDKNKLLVATVKEILIDKHELVAVLANGEKRNLSYQYLIIATGSGKHLLAEEKPHDSVILASRMYIQSPEEKQFASVTDFDHAFNPGYFWVFPLGGNQYNTGVILHDKKLFPHLYQLTESKLKDYFGTFQILSKSKFPLRIYPAPITCKHQDIALIGDAHHNIDPFFGHGIDTAMLEAREQIISLHTTGTLTSSSKILQLIDQKNKFSLRYRNLFRDAQGAANKLSAFVAFLAELSGHYQLVAESIQPDKISVTSNLPESKPEKIVKSWLQYTVGKLRSFTVIVPSLFRSKSNER